MKSLDRLVQRKCKIHSFIDYHFSKSKSEKQYISDLILLYILDMHKTAAKGGLENNSVI